MLEKTYLLFFGPPGSGKGTQVDMLAKKLKLPVISTGEILRQEVERNTELGRKAKPIMAAGDLVPDKLLEAMVSQILKNKDAAKGVIFDGYPRTWKQLDFLISKFNNDNVYAFLIDVSDKEVIARLGGRRACDCGAVYHMKYNPPKNDERCDLCNKKLFIRSDDRKDVILERLKIYKKEINPLLNYWREKGKLIEINGEQSIDKVQSDIIAKLKGRSI